MDAHHPGNNGGSRFSPAAGLRPAFRGPQAKQRSAAEGKEGGEEVPVVEPEQAED